MYYKAQISATSSQENLNHITHREIGLLQSTKNWYILGGNVKYPLGVGSQHFATVRVIGLKSNL